jgi:hypothetical protein
MKKILIIVVCVIIVAGAGWIIIGRSPGSPEKIAPKTECFEEVFPDGSIIKAKFSFDNNSVKGDLAYLWAQKDNSTGTFEGTIKNNIISGNYHFFSEEVYSDNELAFLYDGESLVPGYGELRDNFDPKNKLVKTACK